MINIIILYWDMGCDIRKDNAIISWNELKKMVTSLKEKNININCHIFEFGENFIFDDSIKIPMVIDYFEKSKKINISLNHQVNENCDFIAYMDSDLFFSEDQYDNLINDINLLNSKKENIFLTYNLLDINEKDRELIIDLQNKKINYDKLNELKTNYSWRHGSGAGTLGGFFIVPISSLKMIGGFDEKFLTWGGEDDEAQQRIKNYSSWRPKNFEGPYHLYHPKNENDKKYHIRVYSDEYFQINKVEKPR